MNCRLLALSVTRSALPPRSPFSPLPLLVSILHCSPVQPSILLSLFYASFSSPSSLLYYFFYQTKRLSSPSRLSSPILPLFSSCTLFLSLCCPHNFHFCPPFFIQVYLTHFCCVTLLSRISFPLLPPSLSSTLYTSICLVERQGSPQKEPVLDSVHSILSVTLLRSHEMSKFIWTLQGDIFSRRLLHTFTATMTVTY